MTIINSKYFIFLLDTYQQAKLYVAQKSRLRCLRPVDYREKAKKLRSHRLGIRRPENVILREKINMKIERISNMKKALHTHKDFWDI